LTGEGKVKFLLCVAALLAAVTVHASELSKDTVCDSWARNAIIGGAHASMGHSRRLVPLTLEHILELMEHGKLFGIDGIPVFADEHDTPEGKAFLEDSIFYGFDYVKRTPEDQLPESALQMLGMFVEICRSGDRVVSR
jgi:hypothetical protein